MRKPKTLMMVVAFVAIQLFHSHLMRRSFEDYMQKTISLTEQRMEEDEMSPTSRRVIVSAFQSMTSSMSSLTATNDFATIITGTMLLLAFRIKEQEQSSS